MISVGSRRRRGRECGKEAVSGFKRSFFYYHAFFAIYLLFGLPHRAMIGVQFVMQNFADDRLRVVPGVFAQRAIVTDCRPYFFETADVVFLHFYLPLF